VIKVMDQQLAIDANAGFQYLLTGDESWIACDSTPSRMWTMVRSEIDPIIRPINHLRKTMTIVFFGINSIALIDILAKSQFKLRILQGKYYQETRLDHVSYQVEIARNSHRSTFWSYHLIHKYMCQPHMQGSRLRVSQKIIIREWTSWKIKLIESVSTLRSIP
jgi:hypothetical protein